MKGRSVSYAYSMMVLVFCCGYNDPSGGILLNQYLIPAAIIVYASLYSVYWLRKQRSLTAAVLFSSLVKVHFFDYLFMAFVWYNNLRNKLEPLGYELATFPIAIAIATVSFVFIRIFAIGYQLFVGFSLSVVLNELCYTFFPAATKLRYWGFVPWSVSSLLVAFCCFLMGENFCKFFLPTISSYVITLTMYLCHKQNLLKMDPGVLDVLDYKVRHENDFKAELTQSHDTFIRLFNLKDKNHLEQTHYRLLEKLFAKLPTLSTPTVGEDEIKQFTENYIEKFPRSFFQDRFYSIVFVFLAILLSIIALFLAKGDRKTKEPSTVVPTTTTKR